ncbi:hypothetical protein SKAU_G00193960 [Synaphobranchus kaupii]|uniref:Protein tweety homolog n=1 Tax=Synaphobranchus kaupii TaxID=118154 RepID=A0A9Q1IVH1_SYNKA|nr:hypothetical protein SKAU_G00193960 [Synaphobranchus kaupii]
MLTGATGSLSALLVLQGLADKIPGIRRRISRFPAMIPSTGDDGVFGVLTLVLSWVSLGADTATAVGTSDFCVSPGKFLMNQTKGFISADIVHYYLYCSQSLPNPFQQSLTIFQRSLTTMQIQIQGLLQFAVPLFPTAERDLLSIQNLLNSSEASLHQLTALLDCRSLHKDYLDALIGVCYDGVEGLLYLCLFSLLAACAFCIMLCATSRAWRHITNKERDYDDIDEEDPFNPQARRIAAHNPNMHSFCSYSSSLGSQTSLHPPRPGRLQRPHLRVHEPVCSFWGEPSVRERAAHRKRLSSALVLTQHESHLPVYD